MKNINWKITKNPNQNNENPQIEQKVKQTTKIQMKFRKIIMQEKIFIIEAADD